jgi:hypothetical protein
MSKPCPLFLFILGEEGGGSGEGEAGKGGKKNVINCERWTLTEWLMEWWYAMEECDG